MLVVWGAVPLLTAAVGLPPSDVDVYLVKCNGADKTQLWSLPQDNLQPGRGEVLIRLREPDPTDGSAVCLNCASDRCHGWTCDLGDGNGYYSSTILPDGNITLAASGNGDWTQHHCLASLSGGINSKVEMLPCDRSPAQQWHLAPDTGLLHNRAVQSSQAIDLCLMVDFAGSRPLPPPVRFASLVVDGATTKPLPHFWSNVVGSSHGAMWNRADWLKHLNMAHELAGFNYVRGHGMLDEDVMCWSQEDGTYYNAIRAYSNVLSAGMKPVVELSFTPNELASGTSTAFYYKGENTPPTDMKAYGRAIRAFVQAMVDYFGLAEVATWIFEVYNEPDLSNLGCKSINLSTNASDPECKYFEMYAACSQAIKNVSAQLQVGGPATSAGRWLEDLATFAKENDVALDFLSTHSYPNDPAFGRSPTASGRQADTPEQAKWMRYAAKQAEQFDKPLWITEWSSDPGSRSPYHDTADTAAYIISSVASVRDLGLKAYSYWTFSDVFEEGGIPGKNTPFHGGFGMINLWDVPKPSMRAFELLGMLSEHEAGTTLSGEVPETLTILASTAPGNATLILANHDCPVCADPAPVQIQWVTTTGSSEFSKARIARIDTNHTNPHAAWAAMGTPNYPVPAQAAKLVAASALAFEEVALTKSPDGKLGVPSITVPPHGVVTMIFY